jgi:hypothetical protein
MTFDFEFPDAVARELARAGWSRGRSVDISGWEAELGEQGYRLSPVAAAGTWSPHAPSSR